MKNLKIIEQYSESEIIKKINDGEVALYEILIRRTNPVLYKIGRSYNYNHEDTEDLMQDTFIQAYINLLEFKQDATFKTWIVKIMMNNCYKKQQKFSFKNELPNKISENEMPLFSSNQHTDTTKIIVNKELNFVIENALEKVPFDYRMVFSLREMNGLTVLETAEIMNISESNVKVRLNRAKTMLRKEIEKSYTAEDLFEFNLVYCDRMVQRVFSIIK